MSTRTEILAQSLIRKSRSEFDQITETLSLLVDDISYESVLSLLAIMIQQDIGLSEKLPQEATAICGHLQNAITVLTYRGKVGL